MWKLTLVYTVHQNTTISKKNTPLLAHWIFLHNIQNPLLHFEVPSTKENHTFFLACEHEKHKNK
jgi:hypothetical protein